MSNCIDIIICKLSVLILCYSLGGQCNCLSAIVFCKRSMADPARRDR